MSGSYTNTDGRSDSLNTGAAHDTGLYDPNRHDNQIVAVYDSRTQAEAARDALLGAGIPQSAVQVLDRAAGDAGAGGVSRAEDRNQDEGFWGAIKSLFAPEEDVNAYHHAIDRGHAMVVVTPSGSMDRHRVIEVLESSGPIDFDAKLEEWRQAGYDNAAPRATEAGRAQPTASSGGSGTGYQAGTNNSGTTTSGARQATETVSMPQTTGQTTGASMGLTGQTTGRETTGTETTGREMAGRQMTGNEDTIKVVEERLRVGKREVAKGAVRVRSYVVERPVEEQVRLHEERISIDRHPVDRAATSGDAALFQDKTIEARATSEEAVISKEARVVEEIGIRKEAQDRTETVRDTVRETKVEVDDQSARTGVTGTTSGTTGAGMGTGGVASNSTPGATSSGTNSPRK